MNAPFTPPVRLPTPRPEVREAVRNLLTKSDAFAALSPEKQRQLAKDLALVSDYLAAPEGIEGNRIPGGIGVPAARAMDNPAVKEGTFKEHQAAVSEIGKGSFDASAVDVGVTEAIKYVQGINFPGFVSGLIQNVFQAIVTTSIQQMEEFSKMIASVAKSLEQFMKDNISENAGRDHVKEKFPEMFEIGMDDSDIPQPKLKVREGVEESVALARVNSSISFEGGALKSLDLSDANVEQALVVGARLQLAKQRQQMMASTVLLGINRIVVTSGKIKAKVNFQFQARSNRSLERSAQAMDLARDENGILQTTRTASGTSEGSDKRNYTRDKDGAIDSAHERYAKGSFQFEDKPVITAMSTATEGTTEQLQAKADLTGDIEVNFKSDYLPLDKMATPGMIAAIQGNSTPVDPNVLPSARVATPPPPMPATARA